MTNFRSDNETPVAEPIMAALQAANEGTAWAYAEDQWSDKLDDAFSERFGRRTLVLPLSTGTAANSIALASVTPPWGSVFCHRNAHIYNDESGCPEFYGDGLRLVVVEGEFGKISATGLRQALDGAAGHGVHSYTPTALSLTQSTETGTIYAADEIAALCDMARERGLATHMDGARFANAVASLGCEPAEITWQAGVEMLSFGASKNGCMAAEALLFFAHGDLIERAERLRKRGGHLLSKMRYVSAQLLAYLEDDLWLGLAAHSNARAAEFAAAVEEHPGARLEFPVQANKVFLNWTPAGFERLADEGMDFLMWPGRDDLARFVFGHTTTAEDTGRLIAALEA